MLNIKPGDIVSPAEVRAYGRMYGGWMPPGWWSWKVSGHAWSMPSPGYTCSATAPGFYRYERADKTDNRPTLEDQARRMEVV